MSAETAPPDTEQVLRARGARQVDAVRVLARELGHSLPALDVPGGLVTELAREHGASLALVKGRTETSGPILLRAGFTDYGEERCLWLPAG